MQALSTIDQLARLCGILETTVDARGEELSVTTETKVAVLAAMGLDASSEAAAAASLRSLSSREWGRVLPPVLVATPERGPILVPVTLPADTGASGEAVGLAWTLTLEGGETSQTGQVTFKQLDVLEEQDLDGQSYERRCLTIPGTVPWGYHSFKLAGYGDELTLIIAPERCWLPKEMHRGRRVWGLSTQLYLQRSGRNWGIGDFSDLQRLVEITQRCGADVLGVNPLHAMFVDRPEDASPYSPSDRTLLNILYIDVEAVIEFAASQEAQDLFRSPTFQEALASCRDAALVEYDAVAKLKSSVLKLLFHRSEEQQDPDSVEKFRLFRERQSQSVQKACIFQALREYLSEVEHDSFSSGEWPEEYKTFDSPGVAHFTNEQAERVKYQLWLQWIADEQLERAATAARPMLLGIYRDLAVGVPAHGAEGWSIPDIVAPGMFAGAPPDVWNPAGQKWGLQVPIPAQLRKYAFRPFIELLRANMRHAGALRIDHALGLRRLYWIPEKAHAAEGAYVLYPIEEFIGILALESHRNKCVVIGEDLGTVPEGFRERMMEANILSYRVLFFQKEDDAFISAEEYPALSVSVASSHDLPTLKGWWEGRDLDTKADLDLFPKPEMEAEARQQRAKDREALIAKMRESMPVPEGGIHGSNFNDLAHRFLAQSASMITLLQLDDIAGELDQVNVPSTTDQVPNWRRRQSIRLEELETNSGFAQVSQDINNLRNHPVGNKE